MSKAKEEFFDWAYDTRYVKDRNNMIAWGLVGFFALLSVVSISALVGLTPLKENTPYVFTVDKNTGILEPRTMVNTLNWTGKQAVDFSNVAEYIRLRESYVQATYPKNYEKAVRMSSGLARQDLVNRYAPDKSLSPMTKHRKHAQVDVRFKSVSYSGNNKDVVIARYIKDTKTEDGVQSKHYIATVQFNYAENEALSLSSRLTNPHAFVASNYQNSEEGYQK